MIVLNSKVYHGWIHTPNKAVEKPEKTPCKSVQQKRNELLTADFCAITSQYVRCRPVPGW